MSKANANTVIDRLLGDLIAANEQTTDINMFNHKWTFKMLNAADHVEAIADSSGPIDRVARLFKLEMSNVFNEDRFENILNRTRTFGLNFHV